MTTLAEKKCVPCEKGAKPLDAGCASALLKELPGWSVQGGRLRRELLLKDFVEAIRLVRAIAEVAEAEDHHPDLVVKWGECKVSYITHAIDGLSENDFICAAKLDALFEI